MATNKNHLFINWAKSSFQAICIDSCQLHDGQCPYRNDVHLILISNSAQVCTYNIPCIRVKGHRDSIRRQDLLVKYNLIGITKYRKRGFRV